MRSTRYCAFVGLVLLLASAGYAQPKPEWAVAPDPLPKPAKIPPAFNFVVPARFDFGDAVVSPQNPAVLAFHINDLKSHDWESWDLSTRRRIGHARNTLLDTAFPSPDGLHLIGTSRTERGAAELWSLQTGKLLHRLAVNVNGPLTPIGFAVNEQVVTLHQVNFKNILTAWSIKTGQRTFELQEDRWLFANAAISPGGRYLAYPSKGDVIKLHDLANNQPAAELPPPPAEGPNLRRDNSLKAIAFSPDGAVLAARYEYTRVNRVAIWDLATGHLALDAQISDAPHLALRGPEFQWLPDSAGFVVGLHLFDRRSGGKVNTFEPLDHAVAYRQVLSFYTILFVSKPQQNRLIARTVALPKNDIDKVLASLRAGGQSIDAGLPPFSKADRSAIRQVTGKADPLKAALPSDAALKPAGRLATTLSFKRLPAPDAFHEHAIQGLFFSNPQAARALAVHGLGRKRDARPDEPSQRVWADHIDLATGRTAATLDLPPVARVMDLAPDGAHMAVALGPDRIDVYSINPALKHVVGFRPYESETGTAKNIDWACLLDAQHLLTANPLQDASRPRQLILWRLPECRAIYSVPIHFNSTAAVSANRRYLAVPVREGILLLEARTGNALGLLPIHTGFAVPSFSPDGAKLASVDLSPSGSILSLWNLQKPGPGIQITLPDRGDSLKIDWAAAGYLLANNRYLVDIDKQMIAWRYVIPAVQSAIPDLRDPDASTWFLSASAGLKLAALTLPDDDARKTLAALEPDDYGLHPGMKVSLHVSTAAGDQDVEQKVVADLEQRLAANGFIVAGDQPLRLVTTVALRSGKEIRYTLFGSFERQTATSTEFDARIAFELDGRPVWEAKTSGSNASFFIQMKQGETPQDVINRSVPQLGLNFFTSIPLPRYAPRSGVGFGRSELTPQGPRTTPPLPGTLP